ncbi:MAG TPA: hypothetical protein QGF05_07270, partial [Dehalococcoidia bacterium]|nr:hypothetical protein [Dehalococcoidia bacterium]
KIMGLLDAKLVIPMLYKTGSETAELDGIEAFLKATGATLPEEPENHINIASRDVPENTTIMVLSPRGEMD